MREAKAVDERCVLNAWVDAEYAKCHASDALDKDPGKEDLLTEYLICYGEAKALRMLLRSVYKWSEEDCQEIAEDIQRKARKEETES